MTGGTWHFNPASIGGAFVKTAIKKWHKLRAEALAKQMPDDADDALSVSNTSPILSKSATK
jgi:hypothetical protein